MSISKRVVIVAALVAAVALVFGSAAPPAALAGSTRIVDDNFPSPSACHGAGFATIQAAVDNILPGKSATIKVCAGTYSEAVVINGKGKVKLIGSGATITAPATSPLISATGTTRVTVQGFTLDGLGHAIGGGLISVQEGSVVVTKNVFQNAPSTYGVTAVITTAGSRTLKATGNHFTGVAGGVNAINVAGKISAKVSGNDFTGGIIGVTVAAVPPGTASARVTGNHLQGAGSYGILVQGVNKAKLSGNKVEGFAFGIYMIDSSHSKVSHNQVRSLSLGILIATGSVGASFNKVQANTVEAAANNFIGIYIAAAGGKPANLNQIKGNTITDPGSLYTGTTGVWLSNSSGTLNKTLIKSNKVINIDTPYSHSGDTGTIIHGNHCTPAAPCIP